MDELPNFHKMRDELFMQAWTRSKGNASEAGRSVGVAHTTIWRWAVKKGLLTAQPYGKQ